ncbi:MAG: LacI family DNA-binding transcriptional regulator [Phycisphaeraceae bacterium]|nr:MAG: LacI family DNA-binding transcriptional regulator [Phycisphaeraceae bacterium]
MATTLRDIAAVVGTSEATVSLVLNGKRYHRVSAEVRAKIERVAREMNYIPNRQAQLLAGGRSMTVALLVNRLLNQFFAEYLSAIEAELSAENYHTIPFETFSDPQRAQTLLGMIDQRLCDAIIALEYTDDPSKAADRGPDFPLVIRAEVFGQRHDPWGESTVVHVDYEPATNKLFEHFKAAGATRIGVLCDTRHDVSLPEAQRSPRASSHLATLNRLKLYERGSQCHSLSQEADLAEWAAATSALLTREPGIDCLLVHNATVIPAVLYELAKLGKRVGHDIAVATYDDPIAARWLGGGLTVVREPVAQVTRALVESTLGLIGGDPSSEPILVNAEFVPRASSGLAK